MRQLLLVFALLFSAHLARSAPTGVVVQTWRYDPQTQAVIVRVLNESGKDITAFNLSVTEKYSDGTVNSSERVEDFLPLTAAIAVAKSEEMRQRHGNGTFLAGTGRDVVLGVSKAPTDVLIVPDVVIYADQTADVANNRAFSRMVEFRQGILLAMKQADEAYKVALASSNPNDTAAKKLTELALAAKVSGQTSSTEFTLRRLAEEVNQSDLTSVMENNKARITVYGIHSQVKAVRR